MNLALDLAKKGVGKVNPNPLVGAVLVKGGKIIGSGYHEHFGGPHAEVNAISNTKESTKDATLYVTLEPCCHYGKTPPCTKLIIESGIKRVVVAMMDPNPKVCGKGIEELLNSGIEVCTGILEEEAKKLNEKFIKYITRETPFVLYKSAMSMDGKICTSKGDSKWISCEESRSFCQNLRNEYAAIMVGINTVIADNPSLTTRIENGHNPLRIVVDSNLKVPANSTILNDGNDTLILTTVNYTSVKHQYSYLNKPNVRIISIKSLDDHIDLKDAMKKVYDLGIDSILIEGGGTLGFSAFKEGIIDKINFFLCPLIVGGTNAKSPVEGTGFEAIKNCVSINSITTKNVGKDILIEGYIS